jgi:excisionase family DNA binding protein
VARRLGVSIPTIQRWVDAGHLVAWKTMGGHRRIEAQSAERLFASRDMAPIAAAAARQAPVSVMVVDDNPDDRDILVLLIETALPGAAISVAEGGFQALVAIGQAVPDILVTDILMPHMDGIEMLRQLASQCKVRPGVIIAVSSKTPEQLARLGSLPQDVKFIAKPIDHFEFIATLQTAAQRLAAP